MKLRFTQDDAPPGFFLVFGHPADSPGPEVPTYGSYGWKYGNLVVVFEPALPK